MASHSKESFRHPRRRRSHLLTVVSSDWLVALLAHTSATLLLLLLEHTLGFARCGGR